MQRNAYWLGSIGARLSGWMRLSPDKKLPSGPIGPEEGRKEEGWFMNQ